MRTTLGDPILEAWEDTHTKNRHRTAIFDAQGRVVRTFSEIEERADHFARQLETIGSGQVFAIQIGNHPDWPPLFLACLRKQRHLHLAFEIGQAFFERGNFFLGHLGQVGVG